MDAGTMLALIFAIIIITVIFFFVKDRRETNSEFRDERSLEGDLVHKKPLPPDPPREPTEDERYAREKGLSICPYCETFNASGSAVCCACGMKLLPSGSGGGGSGSGGGGLRVSKGFGTR